MTILITAGPTREAIDPVRYISNKSSGKMGYALAETAAKAGHRVILISGPTCLDIPDRIDFISVESADAMYQAVNDYISKADIAIFAAAVADYRPVSAPKQKIKKSEDSLTLKLIKNPDILGSARSKMNYSGVLVGFAAETENLVDNARKKLKQKNCNFIVANDVSRKDIGFDTSENEVILVFPNEIKTPEKASKHHLAHLILDEAFDLCK